MSEPVAPSGEQIELAHGSQRAVVVEVGGGLRTYSAGGHDVLDGYAADAMCTSGRGQLLLPWPNRIEDGSYEFDGRRHQLALTEPANGNAIHGLVRWAAWAVTEREPGRVVLTHTVHPQPGYPFTLELAVEHALSDEGLRVTTRATNAGAGACPFGAGAHPYLTVGTSTVDDVVLRVPARSVRLGGDRGLPGGATDVDGTPFDFRGGRAIGSTVLDNAFFDLERDDDGLARVELRAPDGRGLALWLDEAFPQVMVFSGDPLPDVARRSLAVEPMTCPPNAFRTGDSVLRLEPGETWTGAWGIAPHVA